MTIHAIFGPTASSKTRLAFTLSQQFSAPLISVDSRKVYKDMNIGTNKQELLDLAKKLKVDVYGTDLFSPTETTSAAEYRNRVTEQISHLVSDNIILFGGTGLYLDGLLFGLPFRNKSEDRASLNILTVAQLQEKLQAIARQAFQNLNESDRVNPRRLIRAIEKEMIEDNPALTAYEQQWAEKVKQSDVILYLPAIEREILYERIESRLSRYFEEGWIEEIIVLARKYGKTAPGMQIMGYKTILSSGVLQSDTLPSPELLEALFIEHRQYAKRQLTWAKRYIRPLEDVYPEIGWKSRSIKIKQYSLGGVIQTDET